MPIEIKELNIKINVEGKEQKSPTKIEAKKKSKGKSVSTDEILDVIKRKNER